MIAISWSLWACQHYHSLSNKLHPDIFNTSCPEYEFVTSLNNPEAPGEEHSYSESHKPPPCYKLYQYYQDPDSHFAQSIVRGQSPSAGPQCCQCGEVFRSRHSSLSNTLTLLWAHNSSLGANTTLTQSNSNTMYNRHRYKKLPKYLRVLMQEGRIRLQYQ